MAGKSLLQQIHQRVRVGEIVDNNCRYVLKTSLDFKNERGKPEEGKENIFKQIYGSIEIGKVTVY